MITREMIQNGFDNGSISIEDEFGGCISLCCRIADNAFYFASMEDVQVTFIGYNDHAPHCEAFAYRNEGKWYWSLDDSDVNVEITAWKHNCEPYDGK